MARIITVGAAQLGPIARAETRGQVFERLLALLRQAKDTGCDLGIRDGRIAAAGCSGRAERGRR